MSDCLFCQVASGAVAGSPLFEDDLVLAFDVPDSHPEKRAPVHFLVIPREHVPSAREIDSKHEITLGRLMTVASRIADEKGIATSGYRFVMNTGDDANQTVHHMHLHCLGGKKLATTG
jgi:histidine triad (HIT) family protein